MRYLRSWLFDLGLMLIVAAPAAAYFISSRTYVVSQPGDLIRASYIDLDLRLPIGLSQPPDCRRRCDQADPQKIQLTLSRNISLRRVSPRAHFGFFNASTRSCAARA